MKVKVLGTGCPKCKRLYQEAEKAIAESGKDVELEKVESIDDILNYGVMMTPALVVNEEVKSTGKIPRSAEMVNWINAALED
ncbi:MAG: TM0996/MTH895 family glutaredoxin-like protein [Deltaproteobacteria bacterium]|nr:TM0996/MTH895 family glutaredoxin-like protein [Deltaproteobacteria bacterium]